MLIEVLPSAGSPWMPSLADKVAVVIDVFRATSTMITALGNGCQSIIPVLTTEEAIERRISEPGSLLGGERKAIKIEGFDLGNSPFEYTPEKVSGRKIIVTTTNGTRAIQAVAQAQQVWIASFVNIESIAHSILGYLANHKTVHGIVIICAGSEDRFDIPDTVCAGMLVSILEPNLPDMKLNDLGRAAEILYNNCKDNILGLLKETEHGQLLHSLGFDRDVVYCTTPNTVSISPILENGEVVWKTDLNRI